MTQDDMPLGRTTTYPETYDPGLLFPVRRAGNRRELGLGQGTGRGTGKIGGRPGR